MNKRIIKFCKQCGKEFDVPPSHDYRIFCSQRCAADGRDLTGKNNPRYVDKIIKICEYCGEKFEIVPSDKNRRFCDIKCYSKWRAKNIRGEKHPRWIDKIIKICKYCGEKFEIYPDSNQIFCTIECKNKYNKENKIVKFCKYCGEEFKVIQSNDRIQFCCVECYGKWMSKNNIGKNHPRWVEKIIKICEYCGKEFEVEPNKIDRQFCSRSCYGKWQSENKSGENSISWQGGISFDPYCEKFNPTKKKEVRDKYNNCDYLTGIHRNICNIVAGKIIELAVHHFDYNKMQGCDGHEWKLVPVSIKHNSMFNFNRPFWTKLIEYSLEYDKEYYNDKIINIFIELEDKYYVK